MRTTVIHRCMIIALVPCLSATRGWAAPWGSARQLARAQAAAPGADPAGGCAVYTWGDNTNGQLADGRVMMRLVPHQVTGIGPVSLISANKGSSLVLQAATAPNSGTLLTWGYGTVFTPDGRIVGQSTPQVVMAADGVELWSKGPPAALC